MLSEQIVYLSASGLACLGRFTVLRLYVFAVRRGQEAARPGVPSMHRSTVLQCW